MRRWLRRRVPSELWLRGRTGAGLLELARWVLKIEPSDSDFDTCVECGVSGCLEGTAEHRPDCPSVTGVHPVRLKDLWPGGPMACLRCGDTLWPGDSYTLIIVGQAEVMGNVVPMGEVACLGCAALAAANRA